MQDLGDFYDMAGALEWGALVSPSCCAGESLRGCTTAAIAVSYLTNVNQVLGMVLSIVLMQGGGGSCPHQRQPGSSHGPVTKPGETNLIPGTSCACMQESETPTTEPGRIYT